MGRGVDFATRERYWHPDWVLVVMLAISLGVNIWLGTDAYRNQVKRATMERLRTGVRVGETVPPFTGELFGGTVEQVTFEAAGQDTIFYFMKASCIWCERNLLNVKAIRDTARAASGAARLILVSLDQDEATLRAYLHRTQLGLPVYFRPSSETVGAYAIRATPYTLVVAPGGKVIHVWPGAYVGAVADEVGRYWSVVLPGLTDPGEPK